MKHSIYDTDKHFSIDPITRVILNRSSCKTKLIQNDHNSERFTFEMPRYIEGHDMSLCNIVQVHYNNIDLKTKEENQDVYQINDVQVSPDDENIVVFSWLISNKATRLIGSLNFLIRFECVNDDEIIEYMWHTDIHTGISVSAGMDNSETVIEDSTDILETWKAEVLADVNRSLVDARQASASAEESATIAQQGASGASASAYRAQASADSARNNANDAENSANRAESAESQCAEALRNVTQSESNVQAYTEEAQTYAENAQESAQSASDWADEAWLFADDAMSARDDAINEAIDAENSKAGAVEAQALAEQYAQQAIESANDAETASAPPILLQASGEHIVIDNASDRLMRGIKVIGKTKQDGTPTIDSPVPIECVPQGTKITVCGKNIVHNGQEYTYSKYGLTISSSFDEDGVIINGTTTQEFAMNTVYTAFLKAGTYTISVTGLNVHNTSSDRVYLRDEATEAVVVNYVQSGLPKTFTVDNDCEVTVRVVFAQNSIYDNKRICFQIESGSTPTEYEPYDGYTIETPCDLYEDDIWYPQTGKVVKQTKIYELDENTEGGFDAGLSTVTSRFSLTAYQTESVGSAEIKSNIFDFLGAKSSSDEEGIGTAIKPRCFIFINKSRLTEDTLAGMHEYFEGLKTAGTPILIYAKLATPIEEQYDPIPNITTKKLITNITNDGDALVDITYVADTEIYIDRAIENDIDRAIENDIANKVDKLSDWELVEEITLEEAVSAVTLDTNKALEVLLKIELPPVPTAHETNSQLLIYNTPSTWFCSSLIRGVVSPTATSYWTFHTWLSGGYAFVTFSGTKAMTGSNTVSSNTYSSTMRLKVSTFERFVIRDASNNWQIPVGTKCQLYCRYGTEV